MVQRSFVVVAALVLCACAWSVRAESAKPVNVDAVDLYFDEPSERQKEALGDKWTLAAMVAPTSQFLWKKYFEKFTNKPYWYNTITKYSSWEKMPEDKLAKDFDLKVDTPGAYRAPPPPLKETPADTDFCEPYLCMNNQICKQKKCVCSDEWTGELCEIPSKMRLHRLFIESQSTPEAVLAKKEYFINREKKLMDIEKMRDLHARVLPTLDGHNLKPVSDPKSNPFPSSFGESEETFPGPRENLHQLYKDNKYHADKLMWANGFTKADLNKLNLFPTAKGAKDAEGYAYPNEYVKYPAGFVAAKKVAKEARSNLKVLKQVQVKFDKFDRLQLNDVKREAPKKRDGGNLLRPEPDSPEQVMALERPGVSIHDFDKRVLTPMEKLKENLLKNAGKGF